MFIKKYHTFFLAAILSLSMVLFNSNLSAEVPPVQAEIEIVLPDAQTLPSQVIEVGETLVLRGLPFPLHKLNGAELHFPEGSLNEKVRIEISLPDFSKISEETPKDVGFGEMIANAISVKVYVDDELVSPYYFEEPVELSLPIPENLPQGIGEQVSEFILAYMDDEGEGIDTEEIKTVFRDEVNRFVRAEVGHFSNIVMTSSDMIPEDAFAADIDVVLPDGVVSQSHAVEVGETLVLRGLPFPLHKLNGAELHFPEGSLNEKVRIEISLPDFSKISEETPKDVGFGK
jgi:phage tail protein X